MRKNCTETERLTHLSKQNQLGVCALLQTGIWIKYTKTKTELGMNPKLPSLAYRQARLNVRERRTDDLLVLYTTYCA